MTSTVNKIAERLYLSEYNNTCYSRQRAVDIVRFIIEGGELVPPAQTWIPCAERMPEMGAIVLCFGKFLPKALQFRAELGHRGKGGFGEYRKLKRGFEMAWIEDVTHWMPLPAPPKP